MAHYTTLTREEAVALVGEEKVFAVEGLNCEFTNRVTDRLPEQGYDEFAASVVVADFDDWGDARLTAHYYQDSDAVAEVEELDALDWIVDHFSLM